MRGLVIFAIVLLAVAALFIVLAIPANSNYKDDYHILDNRYKIDSNDSIVLQTFNNYMIMSSDVQQDDGGYTISFRLEKREPDNE